jgi:hypothetical protein
VSELATLIVVFELALFTTSSLFVGKFVPIPTNQLGFILIFSVCTHPPTAVAVENDKYQPLSAATGIAVYLAATLPNGVVIPVVAEYSPPNDICPPFHSSDDGVPIVAIYILPLLSVRAFASTICSLAQGATNPIPILPACVILNHFK